MYETLTAFVTSLETSQLGTMVIEVIDKNKPEHSIQLPYASYERTVMDFIQAVYTFADEHEEMGIYHYYDILKKNNIQWESRSMEEADVENLGGDAVVALIMGATRADRFCEGALLDFLKEGYIVKWLNRLKELDERNS